MKKSHTAGWVSDSPTPTKPAELFCQVHGTIFQNENAARTILGKDILFPDKVAEARGLSYSEKQLRQLAATLPPEEVLHSLKESSYALMPAPPRAMSLLEVQEREPNFFYAKSGEWYAERKFIENNRTAFGWLAIRKDIVPDSTYKKWDKQCRLLTDEERVPNAAELAWFITTYNMVRYASLFEGLCARTSSVVSDGVRVSLGYSDSDVLIVLPCRDGHRSSNLGLAAARKF